jgi:hypothetical protein
MRHSRLTLYFSSEMNHVTGLPGQAERSAVW